MRLYTIEKGGEALLAAGFQGCEELYGLKENGISCPDMQALIEAWTPEMKEKLEALKGSGKPLEAGSYRLLAPMLKPQQDVICLGVNYWSHRKEAKEFANDDFDHQEKTVYFSKRCLYFTAPGQGVPAYEGLVDSLDYEVELGVIIGRKTKAISVEEALDHVFGYTIINDVSARTIQMEHSQWYLGKSLDGFTPMGPCIVTADEIPDPQTLGVRCYINGELRQNSDTSLHIQPVAAAIEEISRGMTLLPGTVIATGTPSGVGLGFRPPKYLKVGDVMHLEIDRIGVLENPIVKE